MSEGTKVNGGEKESTKTKEECGEVEKWLKENCPQCPPLQRMFLFSLPIFIGLPLLFRKYFCPPTCVKWGKCSKIYPGCCEPENQPRKPPCCN